MTALDEPFDRCEPTERIALNADGERWRGRDRRLGIAIEIVRWRGDATRRARIGAWLARRARVAHPRVAPLVAGGLDADGCWASIEVGEPILADGGWRTTWRAVVALADGLGALHRADLALGDVTGAVLRGPDGAARLGLPSRAPDDADVRGDLVALAAVARGWLGATRDDWFLPARLRAVLDATTGSAIDAAAFSAAAAAVLDDAPTPPRRLRITAIATDDDVAIHVEEPDGAHASRALDAASVAALGDAWRDARATRPAAIAARRALGDGDPAIALAARLVAAALPERAAARLWEPGWRIELSDAGTGLPWRLLVGAASATRGDLRLVHGEPGEPDVVAPAAIILATGAPDRATRGAATACARAASRALGRRAWWPTRTMPERDPLLIAGGVAAVEARIALDTTLRERIAIAIVAGDHPLALRDAAAQIVLDPTAPAALIPALADACCRALAAGATAIDAAAAANDVLRERSAACDPLLCGVTVHGAADLRLAPGGPRTVVR